MTSGVTIGTGGSAGAEGPIVQIGAGIASGIGQLFRISRAHMPILIGCGCAAGISAIFNSPIGGVLFTLEVILLEFSIKTFTPLVLASVIANEFTEASGDLYLASLAELGLLLFGVTVFLNVIARLLVWRVGRMAGGAVRA